MTGVYFVWCGWGSSFTDVYTRHFSLGSRARAGMFAPVVDGECQQNAVVGASEEFADAALAHVVNIGRIQFVRREFVRQSGGSRGFVQTTPEREMLSRQCLFEAEVGVINDRVGSGESIAAFEAGEAGIGQGALPRRDGAAEA